MCTSTVVLKVEALQPDALRVLVYVLIIFALTAMGCIYVGTLL